MSSPVARAAQPDPAAPVVSDPLPDETRNTTLLALHAIVIRAGWIFKTESVIVPAFLDSIAGAGWIRGLLPVFNRAGQSIPAFLLSRRLKVAPQKKWVLVVVTLGEAVPFLLLAWLIGQGLSSSPWLPFAFLILYGIFFGFAGLSQMTAGTLQGKLIPARRRGRLLALSTFGGSVPAVLLAWWLLPGWLGQPRPAYDLVFLTAGICFAIAAVLVVGIREPVDRHREPAIRVSEQLRGAWQILRDHRDYRLLVIVGTIFSSSIMLFPHYQAFARERLDLAGADPMVWVVVQNLSMGVASLVAGPIADRFGNRITLRYLVFAAAAIPLFSVGLTVLERETAQRLFPLIFVGIGWVPIGFRVVTNYVLELSPPEDHPRYLSLAQLCAAAAFVASPAVGLLIDVTSFELAFALEAAVILVGGLLTFRLVEPRHRAVSDPR